ncbi:MAG: acyl-ACP--UDP-N-acetylglucosamine O-acyltransferase [Planctomycetota bacterium]
MIHEHPTAVIDPQARIGDDVSIGPFCVIEAGVEIGDGCHLASHVVVKENTTLGPENVVEDGAVLGGRPQHVARQTIPGRLLIGRGNMIRENVTVHRALNHANATTVGDDNLIMVNAHVAHDCHIGSHVILANNVMLAGHVSIADHAYLSGAVGIHQFCRVGAHCMVGGQARVTKDIPPYVTVDGQTTRICGLNLIGLRRRGFTSDDVKQLKAAYRLIYRQSLTWDQVLETLRQQFRSGPATAFEEFFSGGTRGFVLERRTPADATVPLSNSERTEPVSLRKIG